MLSTLVNVRRRPLRRQPGAPPTDRFAAGSRVNVSGIRSSVVAHHQEVKKLRDSFSIWTYAGLRRSSSAVGDSTLCPVETHTKLCSVCGHASWVEAQMSMLGGRHSRTRARRARPRAARRERGPKEYRPAGLATAMMFARRGWREIRVVDRLAEPPACDDPAVWSDTARFYLIGLGGRGQKALAQLGVWNVIECFCSVVVGRKDWAPGAAPDAGVERIFTDRPDTQGLPDDSLSIEEQFQDLGRILTHRVVTRRECPRQGRSRVLWKAPR